MLRDYLEVSRFFNMGLTGIAPVLGALCMYPNPPLTAIQQGEIAVLFLIGCLAHTYGFVVNDVLDFKIDALSRDLTARPLVSGNITRRQAMGFALLCVVLTLALTIPFYYTATSRYFILLFTLFVAYGLATVYNTFSKKLPGMDFFVAGAVFVLILFGAATVGPIAHNPLPWIVALIGGLQVLFMNMINGAIKDIDHDKDGSARTWAIWLGAKVDQGNVILPRSFKISGYSIEVFRTLLIFLPLLVFQPDLKTNFWILPLLVVFTILTFIAINRLYSIKTFNRGKIRKGIGLLVIVMWSTAPIMLSYLNPRILLLALIPPAWFVLSNIILHKTVLEPKTM